MATSAERQAKYRKRSHERGANGERRINTWVSTEAMLALRRLAKKNGSTQRQMLEKLIIEADEQVLCGLDIDTVEWGKYMNVTA